MRPRMRVHVIRCGYVSDHDPVILGSVQIVMDIEFAEIHYYGLESKKERINVREQHQNQREKRKKPFH